MTKELDYLWQRITDTDHINRTLEAQLGLLRSEFSTLQTKEGNAQAKVAEFSRHAAWYDWAKDAIARLVKAVENNDTAGLSIVISDIREHEEDYR